MGKGGGGGSSPFPNPPVTITVTTDNKLPLESTPNSIIRRVRDSDRSIIQDRHYGRDGRAIRDIDYTNHGNPRQHPIVPHQHRFDWSKPPNEMREKIGTPLSPNEINVYLYNSKFFRGEIL